MKSRTSAWIISVRLPASSGWNTSGSRLRVDVRQERSEQERRQAYADRCALRPSSATAIPMKPICELWMSIWPSLNCQPRMSIAPPIPANMLAIAIARM